MIYTRALMLLTCISMTACGAFKDSPVPPPKGEIKKVKLLTAESVKEFKEPDGLPVLKKRPSGNSHNPLYWTAYLNPQNWFEYETVIDAYSVLLSNVKVEDKQGKQYTLPHVVFRHTYIAPYMAKKDTYFFEDYIINNGKGWTKKKYTKSLYTDIKGLEKNNAYALPYLWYIDSPIPLGKLSRNEKDNNISVVQGAIVLIYVRSDLYDKYQGKINHLCTPNRTTLHQKGTGVVDFRPIVKEIRECD